MAALAAMKQCSVLRRPRLCGGHSIPAGCVPTRLHGRPVGPAKASRAASVSKASRVTEGLERPRALQAGCKSRLYVASFHSAKCAVSLVGARGFEPPAPCPPVSCPRLGHFGSIRMFTYVNRIDTAPSACGQQSSFKPIKANKGECPASRLQVRHFLIVAAGAAK